MSSNFLVVNGVVTAPNFEPIPSIADLLRRLPGVYTTTRTQNAGTALLFWRRHLLRLQDSVSVLARSNPTLLGLPPAIPPPPFRQIRSLAQQSLHLALPLALPVRGDGELAVTVLVSGADLYLHVGLYSPLVFGVAGGGARLAVVGGGRMSAAAKHTDWVRARAGLEKLKGPSVTELLLSNDGDHILEGSVTNFFVVCRREVNHDEKFHLRNACPFEVHTAPIIDGVLPGVIRQLILEICSSRGIPFREVAPSWSKRELWEEAFVTSSLRLVQHVEIIHAPNSWGELHLKTWKEVCWEGKKFESPGPITRELQMEIMARADIEGKPIIMGSGFKG